MDLELTGNPSLTLALALAAGVIAQVVARHLRIPGIVLLLGAGVLLGPDGLGVVQPRDLGDALGILVEYGVAVILFEGGLSLNWSRLRREARTIRLLVSLGAVVTAIGGAAFAYAILQWPWSMSILFGSLVIVTGPTVITPLLRRIKIKRKLETVLEAEGVFIDAVGAIFAVIVLEIVLSPTGSSLVLGMANLPGRLIFGALMGIGGGICIAFVLRVRGLIPDGLGNVLTLVLALALFHVSNAVAGETGIVAVVAAGLVVGNVKTPPLTELREFKEQLTVLFIGMLFVLLAADVRIADVTALGARGLLVVAALMIVVRPASVVLCSLRAGMSWREKAFLSWLAPRGIVAAAVASLFYERLAGSGIDGGAELRALVFLVIAVTVLFQGTTGGWIARLLGVHRPSGQGYAILGAQPIGRLIGRLLRDGGEEVVFIDASAETCKEAEEEGVRVVCGNAMDERVILTAEVGGRKAVVGILPNDAVNLMFARNARSVYKVPRAYVAIQKGHAAVDAEMVAAAGARVLFGDRADLELWSVRLRRGIAVLQGWAPGDEYREAGSRPGEIPKEMQNVLLAVGIRREKNVELVDELTKLKDGDIVAWLVVTDRADEAGEWLTSTGWRRVDTPLSWRGM
jgi:NhaP-type Na+/H+ or K+/H+ antiporter